MPWARGPGSCQQETCSCFHSGAVKQTPGYTKRTTKNGSEGDSAGISPGPLSQFGLVPVPPEWTQKGPKADLEIQSSRKLNNFESSSDRLFSAGFKQNLSVVHYMWREEHETVDLAQLSVLHSGRAGSVCLGQGWSRDIWTW